MEQQRSFSSLDSCGSPSPAEKDIMIQFLIVKEPLEYDGSSTPSNYRARSLKKSLDELSNTSINEIDELIPQEVKTNLLEAIVSKALSLPREADHIFVCVVMTPDSRFDDDMDVESNLVAGIHVEEDKVVSWDLVENNFNPVLQACKPPIPCLKKVKIDEQSFLGSKKEDLSCAICLQDFPVGTEAATTTCSHMYHCHCIVKWLLKSTSCPLCRFRLLVG